MTYDPVSILLLFAVCAACFWWEYTHGGMG